MKLHVKEALAATLASIFIGALFGSPQWIALAFPGVMEVNVGGAPLGYWLWCVLPWLGVIIVSILYEVFFGIKFEKVLERGEE